MLSALSPATLPVNGVLSYIAINPAGTHAYVASYGGSIFMYSIGSNGQLTPLSSPSIATGAMVLNSVIHPSGNFAYFLGPSGANALSMYSVGSDGVLTSLSPPYMATASGATSMSIDSAGKYLYVADRVQGSILTYTIAANGVLSSTATSTIPVGIGSNRIVFTK